MVKPQNYGVIRNSSGVLTGHQCTQELILLLLHYGTAETPTDALWPESPTMKDLHCTDLKQENMDFKHGANEE